MDIRISAPKGFSEVGQKPNQEDALFPDIYKVSEKHHVFIVCDGMGGHEHGEIASNCVAETIGNITSSVPLCATDEMRKLFEKALEEAYNSLDALDKDYDGERTMGTTIAFLAICNNGVLSAHIGDSRIYQLRKGKGVVFKSRDHSLVNELLASCDLDENEAKHFLHKNVITRAIQPHQEYRSRATYNVFSNIETGDVFFLCSDGIVEKLSDSILEQLLLKDDILSNRIECLKEECKKYETCDNHSCYAFEIIDIEKKNNHKRLCSIISKWLTRLIYRLWK